MYQFTLFDGSCRYFILPIDSGAETIRADPLIYSGFGNECWSKQVTQRNNLKYNQIYVRLKGILHRKGNEKSGKQVL